MNAKDYKKQLTRLDLTSVRCAQLFGYGERTSTRWNKTGPPLAVAVVLKIAQDQAHLRALIKAAE